MSNYLVTNILVTVLAKNFSHVWKMSDRYHNIMQVFSLSNKDES